MTSIIEMSVPAAQFALDDTLASVPDARFEGMWTVTTDPDAVMPILVSEGDEDAIEAALETDASVASVSPFASLAEESVYRVDWNAGTENLFRGMFGDYGTVLRARASDGRWWFRVLYSERQSMEHWYDHCRESGVRFDVESIYDPTDSVRPTQCALSKKQYETLETALHDGFYDIPRKVTLEELSAEFDVSHQALSERLSRAHKAMVTNVVSEEFPLADVV